MNILRFWLLNVQRNLVQQLTPVTVLDTFDGATKNFHPDGLYSTEIFGPIGSDIRLDKFSYTDVNAELISPAIAFSLFELKRLYKGILSGKAFATWSEEDKDFFPAQPTDPGADTGYSFFLSHYAELTPRRTDSLQRNETIDFFNKWRSISMSRYVLILPAGLRDLEIGADGREQESELGKMYRKLIATAKMVPSGANKNHKSVDNVRWSLQQAFNDIYEYFFDIEDGKKGFTRGKWAARNVVNGTRNVISSMDCSSPVMGREDQIRPTDTIVGMIQGLRALLPVAIYAVKTKYLQNVDAGNGDLYLIDPKTLKRERKSVSPKDYDLITTDEGVEKIIMKFRYRENKHDPVMVSNMYVALIWSDDTSYKVFYDISELPEDKDPKLVKPLSYCELLYLSGCDRWNKYYGFLTRYPVTGPGSTYSTTIRLVTTTRSSLKYALDDLWIRTDISAPCYPDRSIKELVTSMAPNPTRIVGLGADFDGDTGSLEIVYTDESIAENEKIMNSARYWVSADGKLKVDVCTDVINRTIHNLLADPI